MGKRGAQFLEVHMSDLASSYIKLQGQSGLGVLVASDLFYITRIRCALQSLESVEFLNNSSKRGAHLLWLYVGNMSK
jgi:hypothetical protein